MYSHLGCIECKACDGGQQPQNTDSVIKCEACDAGELGKCTAWSVKWNSEEQNGYECYKQLSSFHGLALGTKLQTIVLLLDALHVQQVKIKASFPPIL